MSAARTPNVRRTVRRTQGRTQGLAAPRDTPRAGRRGPVKLSSTLARTNPELAAALAEQRVRSDNPLRRVLVGCCGWRRDADAQLTDWVWCTKHGDWARVTDVAE